MQGDGHFDDAVAARYDEDEGAASPADVGPVVDALAVLAAGGRALEFAIGTGRIALPLAARGVPVEGIELSQAMVRRLRAKPGGAAIPVTIGDMATTRVGTGFSLVYLVFNTINNLTSQEAQIACFGNAAAHLRPGGRFVVEVQVPPLQRLAFGTTCLAFDRTDAHWGIDEIDVVTQQFVSHHLRQRGDDLVRTAIPFRYVWPSELDLMARMAGMTPMARWGCWSRTPFTRLSASHVSVWEKTAS